MRQFSILNLVLGTAIVCLSISLIQSRVRCQRLDREVQTLRVLKEDHERRVGVYKEFNKTIDKLVVVERQLGFSHPKTKELAKQAGNLKYQLGMIRDIENGTWMETIRR